MSEDDKPRGEPAVKSKPRVKSVRNPEFTPHGISRPKGTRGPSGKTARQAKRQQRLQVALAVLAVVAIAGGTTWYATRPGPEITATGALGKAPKISIPKGKVPEGGLQVNSPIKGTGAKIANGDTTLVKFVFYQWTKKTNDNGREESSNKELSSSFKQPAGQQVQALTIGKTELKGLDKGLVGQTVGSRVILQLPPSDGFGQAGQQLGLTNTDWVVFVIDVLANYPKGAQAQGTPKEIGDKKLPAVGAVEAGKGPKVTIPKNDPPKALQVKPVIEGNGAKIAKGQTVMVHYKGVIWKSSKEFDTSWKEGQPTPFTLADGQLVPGFLKGLVGQKIGSRVMLVLPPKEGYGKDGNQQAGIKGTDTLVFVVDILGTMPK